MKKYRYGDAAPGVFSRIRRYNLLYFVVAWNALGYIVYKYATKDKSEEWKNLSSTKKYLSLMSSSDQEIKVIKIKGAGITVEKERMEDYLLPDPPKPV